MRATLESIASTEAAALVAAAEAAAIKSAAVVPVPPPIVIQSVPEGHYWQADGSFAPLTSAMREIEPPRDIAPATQAPEESATSEGSETVTEEQQRELVSQLRNVITQAQQVLGDDAPRQAPVDNANTFARQERDDDHGVIHFGVPSYLQPPRRSQRPPPPRAPSWE
jgi:hypothetical protein